MNTSSKKKPLISNTLSDALDLFSQEEIIEGQNLRDQSNFIVTDKTKGLWIAQYNDIEVELQLKGKKVKDYRCDCKTYNQTSTCAHLAGLFGAVNLRKQPKLVSKNSKQSGKISTAKLLQAVSHSELLDFIQKQSTKNQELRNAIRLVFAEHANVQNRFEEIIKTVFLKPTNGFNPKKIKQQNETLKHFNLKRSDWKALQDWITLYELHTTLIPRLIIIADDPKLLPLQLKQYIEGCFKDLQLLIKNNPAPVILEKLTDWTTAQLEIGAYFRKNLDHHLFTLYEQLVDDNFTLKDIIENSINKFGVTDFRLAALINTYYDLKNHKAAEQLLIENLDRPKLVTAALEKEIRNNHFKRAIKLAETAIQHQSNDSEICLFRTFLLGCAANEKNATLFARHAPEVVYFQKNLDAILPYKNKFSEEDFLDVLKRCRDLIYTNTLNEDILLLWAEIHLHLKDFEQLEDIIYHTKKHSLVAHFLPQLVGNLPDKVVEALLEHKAREVLDHHFGHIAAERIAKLFFDVSLKSKGKITYSLLKRLRKEYRSRKAFITALNNHRI